MHAWFCALLTCVNITNHGPLVICAPRSLISVNSFNKAYEKCRDDSALCLCHTAQVNKENQTETLTGPALCLTLGKEKTQRAYLDSVVGFQEKSFTLQSLVTTLKFSHGNANIA